MATTYVRRHRAHGRHRAQPTNPFRSEWRVLFLILVAPLAAGAFLVGAYLSPVGPQLFHSSIDPDTGTVVVYERTGGGR